MAPRIAFFDAVGDVANASDTVSRAAIAVDRAKAPNRPAAGCRAAFDDLVVDGVGINREGIIRLERRLARAITGANARQMEVGRISMKPADRLKAQVLIDF